MNDDEEEKVEEATIISTALLETVASNTVTTRYVHRHWPADTTALEITNWANGFIFVCVDDRMRTRVVRVTIAVE